MILGPLAVAGERSEVALTGGAEVVRRGEQVLGIEPGLDALGQLDLIAAVSSATLPISFR